MFNNIDSVIRAFNTGCQKNHFIQLDEKKTPLSKVFKAALAVINREGTVEDLDAVISCAGTLKERIQVKTASLSWRIQRAWFDFLIYIHYRTSNPLRDFEVNQIKAIDDFVLSVKAAKTVKLWNKNLAHLKMLADTRRDAEFYSHLVNCLGQIKPDVKGFSIDSLPEGDVFDHVKAAYRRDAEDCIDQIKTGVFDIQFQTWRKIHQEGPTTSPPTQSDDPKEVKCNTMKIVVWGPLKDHPGALVFRDPLAVNELVDYSKRQSLKASKIVIDCGIDEATCLALLQSEKIKKVVFTKSEQVSLLHPKFDARLLPCLHKIECPDMQALDLSELTLTDAALQEFHCPQLQSLNLSKVKGISAEGVLQMLAKMPALKKLDLSQTLPEGTTRTKSFLWHFTHLLLTPEELIGDGVTAVEIQETLKKQTILYLRHPVNGDCIIQALTARPHLEHMFIAPSFSIALKLEDLPKQCPHLKSLKMPPEWRNQKKYDLRGLGLEVTKDIVSQAENIESLILGHHVTANELTQWRHAKKLDDLTFLDLSACASLNTDVFFDELQYLSPQVQLVLPNPMKKGKKGLPSSSDLKRVMQLYAHAGLPKDLDISKVYNPGVPEFAYIGLVPLKVQAPQAKVTLPSSMTAPEANMWIISCAYKTLGEHPEVVSIALDDSLAVDDDNMLEFIKKFPHLTTLSLQRCHAITDNGVKRLLIQAPHLKHLELNGCVQIEGKEWEKALHAFKRLETFDLSQTMVPESLRKQIKLNNGNVASFDEMVALFEESRVKEIEQELVQGHPEEARKMFMQYLQFGATSRLDTAKAMTLYKLAQKFQCLPLLERCIDFLRLNLTKDNLHDTLAFADECNLPSLRLSCAIFNFCVVGDRAKVFDPMKEEYRDFKWCVEGMEWAYPVHRDLLRNRSRAWKQYFSQNIKAELSGKSYRPFAIGYSPEVEARKEVVTPAELADIFQFVFDSMYGKPARLATSRSESENQISYLVRLDAILSVANLYDLQHSIFKDAVIQIDWILKETLKRHLTFIKGPASAVEKENDRQKHRIDKVIQVGSSHPTMLSQFQIVLEAYNTYQRTLSDEIISRAVAEEIAEQPDEEAVALDAAIRNSLAQH